MEEIAAVYARSLFEVASEQDKLDDVREQLGEFDDALAAARSCRSSSSPRTSPPRRRSTGLDKAVVGRGPELSSTSSSC